MYRSTYRRDRTAAESNLTPLIDVTFLLIIFFIVAGTFASMDKVSIDPPELASTQHLADLSLPHKAVVQVLPHTAEAVRANAALAGQAAVWQIGPIRIEPGDAMRLTEELVVSKANFARRKAANPALADAEFQVEVRADRSVCYASVRPALAAVAAAGFDRVHYVAVGAKPIKAAQ